MLVLQALARRSVYLKSTGSKGVLMPSIVRYALFNSVFSPARHYTDVKLVLFFIRCSARLVSEGSQT